MIAFGFIKSACLITDAELSVIPDLFDFVTNTLPILQKTCNDGTSIPVLFNSPGVYLRDVLSCLMAW